MVSTILPLTGTILDDVAALRLVVDSAGPWGRGIGKGKGSSTLLLGFRPSFPFNMTWTIEEVYEAPWVNCYQ